MPSTTASETAHFAVMLESGQPAFIPIIVGFIMDNIDPPWKGEKRMVFLVILAVAQMVIGET